jgi:hypothetical protein
MTKRAPISMTIVDKRVLVCGLKNHAFTAINFKENFRQVGMSWNASGNDWVQVFADQSQCGFFRVWERENMTYGKIIRTSHGFDISWSNDHLIKADLMILGEIDARTLLFYSFTDRQLATYDIHKLTTSFVKMALNPVPALM